MDSKKLPDDKKQRLILDMAIGEGGYVDPEAVWVDSDGTMYIDQNHFVNKKIGGDYILRIVRVQDGYIAYIYRITFKWYPNTNKAKRKENNQEEFGVIVDFGRKKDMIKKKVTKKTKKEIKADVIKRIELLKRRIFNVESSMINIEDKSLLEEIIRGYQSEIYELEKSLTIKTIKK